MNTEIIDNYTLSKTREEKLWECALFVFDSSALLDFYNIPKSTRYEIYDNIFKKLPERLWIPFHVQYEYIKNRHNIITKTIAEKYDPLKKDIKDITNLIEREIPKKMEDIINKTKKKDNHPYLEQEFLHSFKKTIDDFIEDTQNFKKNSDLAIKEKDIKDAESNDDVLNIIRTSFSVSREYLFDEIIEISKEGKHRYEFGIPPGYGDSSPKYRKKGTQIFGDLIIWKQILEHSKESKKPVIFITNDIKKDEDWCYLEKNNPDRIDKPREELIKEIKDYSGVEFWMYSLTQFLYKANTYLKSDIREDIIDNIATKFGETENSNQLAKKVLDILTLFNDLCPIQNENYEEEIINGLVKYINTLSPELTILHETSINSYSRDLIIRENNQVVLIEVNFIKTKSLLYRKINELLDTLVSENIFNGVLYTPYFNNPYSFKFGSSSKNIDGKTYHVSQVFAKVAQ